MDCDPGIATALSRRALVTAGAGWVLGAAGLLLPAARDEADARGGALGGRHGQNQRGRDKHHGQHEHDGHHRRSGDQSVRNKDVKVTFINGTSQTMRFLQAPFREHTEHFIAPTARQTFTGG
jgi:hypothetical protein